MVPCLYTCTHCDYTNQYPGNVKTHIVREHNVKTPKVHKCQFCGEMFESLVTMNAHIEKSCVNSKKELAKEAINSFGLRKRFYDCLKCSYQSEVPVNVINHMIQVHNVVDPKIYKCHTCGHEYRTHTQLKIHSKECEDVVSVTKSTNNISPKNKVQENKQQEKPFVENSKPSLKIKLPKNFAYVPSGITKKKGLVNDKHKLKRVKKFKCLKCGYKSKHASHVIRHLSTVHKIANPKLHKCKICGKRFKHFLTLNTHIRTNCGTIPDTSKLGKEELKCLRCGYTSFHPHHMRRHMETVHGDVEPTVYKCELCDETFETFKHMKIHLKNDCFEEPSKNEVILVEEVQEVKLPEKKKIYNCAECNYCSEHKSFVRSHTKLEHKKESQRPFKCTICNEGFQYNTEFKAHVMKCQKINGVQINDTRRRISIPPVKKEPTLPLIKKLTPPIKKQLIFTIKNEHTSVKGECVSPIRKEHASPIKKELVFAKKREFASPLKKELPLHTKSEPVHQVKHEPLPRKRIGPASRIKREVVTTLDVNSDSSVSKPPSSLSPKIITQKPNGNGVLIHKKIRVTNDFVSKEFSNNQKNNIKEESHDDLSFKKSEESEFEDEDEDEDEEEILEQIEETPTNIGEMYPCLVCEYKSIYPWAVRTHMARVHSISNPKIHKCKFCGEMLQHLRQLKHHMGKSFCVNTNKDFAKQRQQAERLRLYNCSHCSYKTAYSHAVRGHLKRRHSITGSIFHRCPICREVYMTAKTLEIHKCVKKTKKLQKETLISSPEKSLSKKLIPVPKSNPPEKFNIDVIGRVYICNMCEDIFDTKLGLHEHKVSLECSNRPEINKERKIFGRSLLFPILTLHQLSMETINNYGTSKQFHGSQQKSVAKQSVKTVAPKGKVIRSFVQNCCVFCPETFSTKRDLDRHLLKHEKSPPNSPSKYTVQYKNKGSTSQVHNTDGLLKNSADLSREGNPERHFRSNGRVDQNSEGNNIIHQYLAVKSAPVHDINMEDFNAPADLQKNNESVIAAENVIPLIPPVSQTFTFDHDSNGAEGVKVFHEMTSFPPAEMSFFPSDELTTFTEAEMSSFPPNEITSVPDTEFYNIGSEISNLKPDDTLFNIEFEYYNDPNSLGNMFVNDNISSLPPSNVINSGFMLNEDVSWNNLGAENEVVIGEERKYDF